LPFVFQSPRLINLFRVWMAFLAQDRESVSALFAALKAGGENTS
jgi:hypothetical protein